MPVRRSSRVFTISFPEDLARQVDQIAKEESRNLSELFREAFRTYHKERVRERLRADLVYAKTRNQRGFRPEDVENLVNEVRRPPARKQKAGK